MVAKGGFRTGLDLRHLRGQRVGGRKEDLLPGVGVTVDEVCVGRVAVNLQVFFVEVAVCVL